MRAYMIEVDSEERNSVGREQFVVIADAAEQACAQVLGQFTKAQHKADTILVKSLTLLPGTVLMPGRGHSAR